MPCCGTVVVLLMRACCALVRCSVECQIVVLLMRAGCALVRCSVECHVVLLLGIVLTAWSQAELTVDS